ncbi:MAG TPA: cupin domain-containing protein [Capillimicrobium sp.]|nr:cupin domain-containing protein [Capillimicrobium sp.]
MIPTSPAPASALAQALAAADELPEPFETSLGFRGRFLPSDDPDVLIGESWVAPGGGAGPLHRHLRSTERFDVLEGAITVRLGRHEQVVHAGGSFTVPAGAPHTFVNHTGEEAHFTATFTPGHRIAEVFEALLDIDGQPSLREAARLMAEFPEDFFYLAHIPVGLQRAVGRVVRALAPSA